MATDVPGDDAGARRGGAAIPESGAPALHAGRGAGARRAGPAPQERRGPGLVQRAVPPHVRHGGRRGPARVSAPGQARGSRASFWSRGPLLGGPLAHGRPCRALGPARARPRARDPSRDPAHRQHRT